MEQPCSLCYHPALKKCGACGIPYCSAKHQKLSWIFHRRSCGKDMNEPWIYQPPLSFREVILSQQVQTSITYGNKSVVDTTMEIDPADYDEYLRNWEQSNSNAQGRNKFICNVRFLTIQDLPRKSDGDPLWNQVMSRSMLPYANVARFQCCFNGPTALNSKYASSAEGKSNHKQFVEEFFRLSCLSNLTIEQLPEKSQFFEEGAIRIEAIKDRIKIAENDPRSELWVYYWFYTLNKVGMTGKDRYVVMSSQLRAWTAHNIKLLEK